MSDVGRPLLEVRNLQKFFPITRGFLQRVVGQVRAVDGVDFSVNEGETLGLVGESGCGKTTASRCILRAIDPTGGQILYRTRSGQVVDLAALSPAELLPLRAEIQMIFQDPFGSLNPRMNLLDNVGEPLLVNGMKSRRERADRVAELLRLVGLRPEFMHRFRTPSRAVSASASASPARSPPTRAWWSPTSRCRPSTSRCRRRY
jgi:peptide/nickel transport system ATP-binding protein